MKKKKNGFTLIELLVTVAIMLSVLGLAIVSFVTVSNRKKEEAFGLVKDQILLGARQYFTSNEYLYEGLDETATGQISLGKLVGDDYINKVTDPRTGKALSKCTMINVKKVNGALTASFENGTINDPENDNCSADSIVIIQEEGAPKLNIELIGTAVKEDPTWFNGKAKDGSLKIKVSRDIENNSGKILSLKKCVTEGSTACTEPLKKISDFNGIEHMEKVEGDTSDVGRMYHFEASNSKGTARLNVSVKQDMEAPKFEFKFPENSCKVYDLEKRKYTDENSDWYNADVTLNLANVSSDVKSWELEKCIKGKCTKDDSKNLTFTGETADGEPVVVEAKVTVTDKATRKTTHSVAVKIDKKPPEVMETRQGITRCHDINNITDTYGFSIQYKDDLSRTRLNMKFKNFEYNWQMNKDKLSTSDYFQPFTVDANTPSIFTGLITRGDRAAMFEYTLTDEACNTTVEYMEKKVGGPTDAKTSPYECNVRDWYDAPVNQGIAQ